MFAENKTQTVITQKHIEKAMNYGQYTALLEELLAQGKTTGENHSEAMVAYAKLNKQRMDRLDKTTQINPALSEALKAISKPVIWLVLTEGWCGDAAQNVPVIHKMALENPNIRLLFLLRDENPAVMDAYLTAGTRSIPKLIWLNEDLEEFGTWGPRPEPTQFMLAEYKANPDMSHDDFANKVHKWYADDKTQSIQKEFLEMTKEILGQIK